MKKMILTMLCASISLTGCSDDNLKILPDSILKFLPSSSPSCSDSEILEKVREKAKTDLEWGSDYGGVEFLYSITLIRATVEDEKTDKKTCEAKLTITNDYDGLESETPIEYSAQKTEDGQLLVILNYKDKPILPSPF